MYPPWLDWRMVGWRIYCTIWPHVIHANSTGTVTCRESGSLTQWRPGMTGMWCWRCWWGTLYMCTISSTGFSSFGQLCQISYRLSMELLQQQQQFNLLLLQICLPMETGHLNPTEEDMEGVSQALARIQFVYRYSHFPILVHCVF